MFNHIVLRGRTLSDLPLFIKSLHIIPAETRINRTFISVFGTFWKNEQKKSQNFHVFYQDF